MGKKKKTGKAPAEGDGKPKKNKAKREEDPFGKADEYPKNLALQHKHFVEFHERADSRITLDQYSARFQQQLMPREQVMCFQQIIVFDQMIGRMISIACKFAYETDYYELLQKLCAGVKQVLGVQKVRLFGVDYNSLGMARELWMVGGERALLGHRVALEEWAGVCATGPPQPTVSHAPLDDAKRYGLNYLEMDTFAKFTPHGLCSVSVRMRDALAGKARPRYVLEVYNKQKVEGKGTKDFTETDAYVTGCVARACGAAIAWVLGNMQNARCSEFASAVLSTNSLREFTEQSCRALERLFNCEEAVLFWVDDEHGSLWRFPTETEIARNVRQNQTLGREFVSFDTVCLAMEAFKKIDMSGAGEQFVLNVPNAQRHPKFSCVVDEKFIDRGMVYGRGKDAEAASLTRGVLSVPIAKNRGTAQTIAVVQLRNKLTDPAVKSDFNKEGIFRTDDATFLQHFALQASSVFEHALAEEEGREAELNLEQSRYCASSLMKISHTLARGEVNIDDLFPLVVGEATKLMNCDRATLFLVHEPVGGDRMLWSQIATGCPPIMVPLKDTSIAGSTVCKKVVTNIADAYRDARFDPQWDRKSGYRTRSILCVPIVDETRGSKCIGCLQLINKKDRFDRMYMELFNARDTQLANNLASVVAIAVKAANQEKNADASLSLAVGVSMRESDKKYGDGARAEGSASAVPPTVPE